MNPRRDIKMKPINIKHFHKIPILMKLLLLIGMPPFIYFFIAGIAYQIAELALIGGILLATLIVGGSFYLNYGIRITSKRVTLMSQHMWKVFRYEDVTSIEIVFEQDIIHGEVKAKGKETYDFYFDGIDLSTGSLLGGRFWSSGIRITQRLVDKSIAACSVCEKVKIKNSFNPPQK